MIHIIPLYYLSVAINPLNESTHKDTNKGNFQIFNLLSPDNF